MMRTSWKALTRLVNSITAINSSPDTSRSWVQESLLGRAVRGALHTEEVMEDPRANPVVVCNAVPQPLVRPG